MEARARPDVTLLVLPGAGRAAHQWELRSWQLWTLLALAVVASLTALTLGYGLADYLLTGELAWARR